LSHKNVHVLQDLVNSKLVNADMLMRQNKLSIKYASQCTCWQVYEISMHAVPLNWPLSMFTLVPYHCRNDMCEVFGRIIALQIGLVLLHSIN